jgi:hypothetical protein
LFRSEAGAGTRGRGAKGRRRVKLRTLKDGHRKQEISCPFSPVMAGLGSKTRSVDP